ncbi:MAG: DNA replication/repair protein RecF [Lachnospiraceae bacterium]|nr:DNA replication/repair protein RecF [Lachnospiraceae bacterium]
MFIKDIALNNFRNYSEGSVEFAPGINILYGENAQGKTNILEALYMIATTKSHRESHDREIIKFDQTEGHIRAQMEKSGVSHRIDMHLKKAGNKGIAIDMIPVKRSAELIGLMSVVFFSPEDLSIVKNGPAERRRFVDMELCQLSRIYFNNLSNYNKVLSQRNNLLKQIYFDKSKMDTLPVWDLQLVEYGKKIIEEREKFIALINEIIPVIHSDITGGKEKLRVEYVKNTDVDCFEDNLASKLDTELKLSSTQTGPHRDDLRFVVNDIDVRKYGSQGQQRTAALSLKLAEIELVKRMSNDDPVLLLDDVMSELDSGRRDALMEKIRDIQTIITCTGYDDFIKKRIKLDRIYRVVSGTVMLETGTY